MKTLHETNRPYAPELFGITKMADAIAIAHTLSKTSKMHGTAKSWSIPASACITGSKLRNIAGSTCSGCYAFKGSYSWSTTQKALQTRLDKFNDSIDSGAWIAAMVYQIGKSDKFRWFDSGDLQSVKMLKAIATIAELTPNCSHWLPTREKSIVRQYGIRNVKPGNLVIRVSAAMVNSKGLPDFPNTSSVHSSALNLIGFQCPATIAGNIPTCKANSCSACWDSKTANISYNFH
jgi:hypothetical protein